MVQYHIGKNGPSLCRAQKGNCPLGGEHFNSMNEAYEHYEKDMESRDVPAPLSKKYPEPSNVDEKLTGHFNGALHDENFKENLKRNAVNIKKFPQYKEFHGFLNSGKGDYEILSNYLSDIVDNNTPSDVFKKVNDLRWAAAKDSYKLKQILGAEVDSHNADNFSYELNHYMDVNSLQGYETSDAVYTRDGAVKSYKNKPEDFDDRLERRIQNVKILEKDHAEYLLKREINDEENFLKKFRNENLVYSPATAIMEVGLKKKKEIFNTLQKSNKTSGDYKIAISETNKVLDWLKSKEATEAAEKIYNKKNSQHDFDTRKTGIFGIKQGIEYIKSNTMQKQEIPDCFRYSKDADGNCIDIDEKIVYNKYSKKYAHQNKWNNYNSNNISNEQDTNPTNTWNNYTPTK